MNTSRLLTWLTSALAATALALPAAADHGRSGKYRAQDYDFARVTDVDPIYKTITHRIPERSCWTETRYLRDDGYRSNTPVLLGSLVGGALGNELGHNKSNKRVGAVVGAVLGASVARDWRHQHSSGSGRVRAVNEEVCEVNERVEYEERIVGYNVTYRYQGQTYHTRMNHHPGRKLKVAVSVTPVY